MERKKHIPTDDQLDAQIDSGNGLAVQVDPKVGIVRALTNTVMSSKIIQFGILAVLLALAIAIAQGNIASMFGITFKDTPPRHIARQSQADTNGVQP